jgi:hypothetical protein
MTNAMAPLTTISLAAHAENGAAPTPRVYRLGKRFPVVQFDLEAKGRIVFLPEGAELHLIGPSSALSKGLEVVCKNELYNIFEADLLGPWSTPVKNSRRGVVHTKAVGACA